MHLRVVRFTDVTADRIEEVATRIKESGGPPEGVPSTGIQLVFDEGQGTAVVIQHYESAEDLEAGERVLGAMDASDTPGNRASVDKGEVKVDLHA